MKNRIIVWAKGAFLLLLILLCSSMTQCGGDTLINEYCFKNGLTYPIVLGYPVVYENTMLKPGQECIFCQVWVQDSYPSPLNAEGAMIDKKHNLPLSVARFEVKDTSQNVLIVWTRNRKDIEENSVYSLSNYTSQEATKSDYIYYKWTFTLTEEMLNNNFFTK